MRWSGPRSFSEMERFELRVEGQEEACVFIDVEGEWLKQREPQVQRPWSGAEPPTRGEQRAACAAGVDGEGERERAEAGISALRICTCRGVAAEVENESLGGGAPPPAGSSRRVGADLHVPHGLPSPGNSLGHGGLCIFVQLMNNQSLKYNLT